jgi:hypothetical protein
VRVDPAAGAVDVGTAAATCNAPAANPVSAYFAKADPVTPNASGTRFFATDTRSTIFQDTAASIADPITPSATLKPAQ